MKSKGLPSNFEMVSSSETDHEFGALNTLLLAVILGLVIMSAYTIKQNQFYYLPESAAAILVGAIVGGLARWISSQEEIEFLTFDPEIFFFLLLPPIIFEAGYALKKKDFFANFWTISLFTVFGTLISTFVIGYGVYFMGLLGLANIDTSSPMESLLFGALLSSVDPMATLSIMGNPEINCDPLLYSLVFGESVLNDAVAISLFRTFMLFYESAGGEFSSATIFAVIANFTVVSLGSVIAGVAIGLVCCYLCKNTMMRKYPEYEISMLFLFAYGSYSFSEALQLSGIMSLFFCGVVLSHYNTNNLSLTSRDAAHNIFKSLAVLSEYFVFLYLGMGIFTGRSNDFNMTFLLMCTVLCIVGRFLNIFPLSALANMGRKQEIPLKMQSVIWFAGLRGAISYALAQNMPDEHKDLYVSTTLGIVIFTTFVCGGLTEPMLNNFGMKLTHREAMGSASPSASMQIVAHSQMQYEKVSNVDSSDRDESDLPEHSVPSVTAISHSVLKDEMYLIDDDNNAKPLRGIGSSIPNCSLVIGKKSFFQRIETEWLQPTFGSPRQCDN